LSDIQILMLEFMQLIDMAHVWDLSTQQGTTRHLGRLINFGWKRGIDLFSGGSDHPTSSANCSSFVIEGIGVYSPGCPEDG
jgi:hypothetical protein